MNRTRVRDLLLILTPFFLLEMLYAAVLPRYNPSVNRGLHYWMRFLFLSVPISGRVCKYRGIAKSCACVAVCALFFFLYMHGESCWCCNSPEANEWKCNEVHKVARAFDTAGIRWRPAWGSAMGALRRGEPIPWEKDEDMCVHPDDCIKAHAILGLTDSAGEKGIHCKQPDDWKFIEEGRNWYSSIWLGPGTPLTTTFLKKDVFIKGDHPSEISFDLYICYEEKEDWLGPKENVTFCGLTVPLHTKVRKEMDRAYGGGGLLTKGWTHWSIEPIQPYPEENSIVFFPRMKFGTLNRIAQDIGCKILLDRGLFYPRSTLQWLVYRCCMLTMLLFVAHECWLSKRQIVLPKYKGRSA